MTQKIVITHVLCSTLAVDCGCPLRYHIKVNTVVQLLTEKMLKLKLITLHVLSRTMPQVKTTSTKTKNSTIYLKAPCKKAIKRKS